MAGISSKGLNFGDPRNKEKTFQGQHFDDDLDLNWVQFKWRNHDPEIGRFIEIDPLAEEYVYNSTYAFSENKVTSHIELEGLESSSINPEQLPTNQLNPWALNKLGKFVPKDDPRPLSEQLMGDLKLAAICSSAFGIGILADIIFIKDVVEVVKDGDVPKSTKSKSAPENEGIPNSSKIEKKDLEGKTTKYSSYNKNGKLEKQVESDRGTSRHGIEGATKKTPIKNTNPKTGKEHINGYKIEKAKKEETPPGKNIKQ